MREEAILQTTSDYPNSPIDWSMYLPRTNVFWLHYLARRLIEEVGLEKPATRGKRKTSEQEIACYKQLERIEKALDPKSKNSSSKSKSFGKLQKPYTSATDVEMALTCLLSAKMKH